MRRTPEILFSLFIVLVVAWVVSQSAGWMLRAIGWHDVADLLPRGWGPRSGLFPVVIALPVLAMAIVQLVVDLRTATQPRAAEATLVPAAEVPPEVVRQRSIVILATIVGWVFAIWTLGFIVSTPLATFLYLKVGARENWLISLGLAAAAGVSFYVFFVYLLHVPAPPGVLLAPFFE